MTLISSIRRLIELYRNEGVLGVVNGIKRFTRIHVLNTPYSVRKRTDSAHRWELIEEHLSNNHNTVLDVGCASGYFTSKAAESGRISIGLDIKTDHLRNARQLYGDVEGAGFMYYPLSPDNVDQFPSFDIVFLLTVYHHWCDAYGRNGAEEMLRELARSSSTIVFEPPGTAATRFDLVGPSDPHPDESIQEYYEKLLANILDERVKIKHIGDAPYPSDEDRTDPIFILQCDEFT